MMAQKSAELWAATRILAPTDFSSSSVELLLKAASVAARFGAHVDVLHVTDDDGNRTSEVAIRSGQREPRPAGSPRDLLADDMRTLLSFVPVAERDRFTGRLVPGEIAEALVEAARGYDLVIMGTHGRSSLERFLLGSVAQEVVRRVSAPVLTVKPTEAPAFPRAFDVTLRDGSSVVVRPIVPEDREALREGISRLSARSRYRRFMAPVRELTDAQLRQLTDIDYHDHMAWGAVGSSHGEEVPLGVARYIRQEDDPHAAEAAVAVVDSHHGKGLGSLLLAALTRSAALNGVEVFRGYVLDENAPMRRILEECQARTEPVGEGCLRLELPVPKEVDSLPRTPMGRVFRAVAREMAPPPIGGLLATEPMRKVADLLGRWVK